MIWLAAWAASAAVFGALDLVWIGVAAKPFYRGRIGHLLARRFRGGAAAAFYAVYITGIVHFAVSGHHGAGAAALDGALFGMFCYATYNLTNFATLRDWPLSVVIVDTGWGALLTALAAAAGQVAGAMAGGIA